MMMHHVLIILTLTFMQGHTNLNHENNKCSIISDFVQAIPVRFAVKIVFASSDVHALCSRSQMRLKLYNCFTIIAISRTAMAFNIGMAVDLCMSAYYMLVLMTLTLMQGRIGSAKANIQC